MASIVRPRTSVQLDYNYPSFQPPPMNPQFFQPNPTTGTDYFDLGGSFDPSAIPVPQQSGRRSRGRTAPVPPAPPANVDLNVLMAMLTENQTALQQSLIDVMAEVACRPVIQAPAQQAPSVFHGNSVKLRNARLFSGKHAEVTPFLSEVKRIIAFNPASFPDDHSKILFVALNLKDGIPVEWYNHLELSNSALLWSWNDFLAAFRKKFADPSLITTADQRLDNLKQTGSAHYYLTSFMELASHLDMTEQTKISRFMKGLKPSIKDLLVNVVNRPVTLEGWEPIIISIDTNLYQRDVERRLENGNSNGNGHHASNGNGNGHQNPQNSNLAPPENLPYVPPVPLSPAPPFPTSFSDVVPVVVPMDVDAISASSTHDYDSSDSDA
jgi:hypothetical protein